VSVESPGERAVDPRHRAARSTNRRARAGRAEPVVAVATAAVENSCPTALGFAAVRIFRKIERSPDLREHGIPGRATIGSLEMLQQGEFRISAEKTEQMMRGEGSPIRAKLALDVQPGDGRPAYPVTLKVAVPMMQWARLGVGGSVGVLVDPKDAKRVEIDWEAEIAEPTIEQRAEQDPVLRELLDRRVDPPPG
jgi:hypothetical protein